MTDSEKIDLLLEKFITMDAHLDRIDTHLEKVDEHLERIDERLDGIEERLGKVEARLDEMNVKFEEMDIRLTTVENCFTDLNLKLENETNKSIRLLAENHSNLIDKLNQAVQISDKRVLFEIQVDVLTGRVDNLEKEVSDIKRIIV